MNLGQRTNIVITVVLLVVFTIGGYYFLKPSYEVSPAVESGPVIRGPKKIEKVEKEKPKERIIEMTAKRWIFEPNVIAVQRGEKVILKIRSVDVRHGFSLPDFGVVVELAPGKTETVEFVADKIGEFEFRCSVVCGEGHLGMKGKLIVK